MTPINKDTLIEYGFIEPTDGSEIVFPLEKVLGENEEGKIHLVVTRERNSTELCIKLPDGSTIFLGGCRTIEDLKIIENSITEYEPNY